jgi:hypothetical protein
VETTDFADTRLQTQEGKADSIPHMVHVDYSVPKSLWKDLLLISFGDGHLDFAKIDSAGRGQLSHRYLDFGYYPVKLFSNRRLLSLLPVLIANPTWLVSVADEHNRNMISVKPILREGVLTLREKDAYRFTQDTLTRVGVQFRKFQDFGVEGDNCTAEFRIRCPANTSNRHTPKVTIKLSFRNESAYFTLDKSNTARSYYHKISDFIMPLTDQIRYFRQDISDWSILTFENQNKNYRIRLNDKIIYEGKYSQKLGPLYGIQMRFVGIGEIDHVLIYDKNRNLVFRENF